jgi:hypothetical protein
MEELKDNLHYLKFTKDIVLNKNPIFFTHQVINEKSITPNTISIVMTAHERSKQTYFTLYTINKCKFKDIQLILVDDSKNDPINVELLKCFNIHIEFITIKKGNKFWTNACINYNIGFQYIKGSKVVIQNAEVCYVGDVLNYINNNVNNDNEYYVFDVAAVKDFESNEQIYKIKNLDLSIYTKDFYEGKFNGWYQHSVHKNSYFHNLVALTKNTFNKIKGFSYDYAFGKAFDDNDFIILIEANNIKMINIVNEVENVGGIHLHHGYSTNISEKLSYVKEMNMNLFHKKKRYLEVNKIYLELSDCKDYAELNDMYNKLNKY